MPEHFLILDQGIESETVTAQSSSSIVDIGPNKKFTISVDGKCYVNWAPQNAAYALSTLTTADFTNLSFTAPDQIVRSAGSWVTDGYSIAGRTLVVDHSTSNDGTYTVESATATNLTTVEVTIQNEANSTTEVIKGTRPLEVDDTAVLLPAAGSYDFKSGGACESIRIYNPDAITSLLVTVYIADNI